MMHTCFKLGTWHVLLAFITDGAVVGAFLSDCCNMLLGSLDNLWYSSNHVYLVYVTSCGTGHWMDDDGMNSN